MALIVVMVVSLAAANIFLNIFLNFLNIFFNFPITSRSLFFYISPVKIFPSLIGM